MNRFDFDQSSIYKTPDESPGFLLWKVSTLWRRSIERSLKPLGLTHPQFVILASTAWQTKNGKNASQIEIGSQASLDPNTTSQILRSLQKKGLIERTRSTDERRKYPILTLKGNQLLAEALPIVEKADTTFFASINLKERPLLRVLQDLCN